MKCSKPGCEKLHRARGFCINHYGAATLEARKASGYVPVDLRRSSANWSEADYEDYWQFVKREVGIV